VRHVRLVFFSRFCFISPFLFLLSRVPHFLSFPPPDLERRRREAARAAPMVCAAAIVDPLPPPLPLVSYPFISSPFSFLTRLGFPAAAAWSIRAHRSSPLAGEAAWARPQHAPVLETETRLGMAWISRKRWWMRPASTTRERRERGRFLRAVVGARRRILR